jgi:hypothetical protein
MMNKRRAAFPVCLLVLAIGLVEGCGGEYERRLNQTVATMGQNSEFSVLKKSVDYNLQNATATVRFFENFQLVNAADAKRARFPVLADNTNLANMLTYEATVEDSNKGQQHYYLYIASLSAGVVGNDDLQVFANRLREKFPDVNMNGGGQDANVTTPDGTAVPWKKIHGVCPQEFYYRSPDGQDQFPQQEGVLEVWSKRIDQANKYLILMWRVPANQRNPIIPDLDKKAQMVAGGVVVK